jgi:apolipoprotein N-acyltransferase
VADVALLPGGTIYRRIGDVVAWACCGVAVVLFFVGLRRRRRAG